MQLRVHLIIKLRMRDCLFFLFNPNHHAFDHAFATSSITRSYESANTPAAARK
jgi:hypothetical protein